ncbi:hypothetical protein K505DRAFT_341047 [Melanomma pulvis-pyrius CBS 109.77]|uniref:Transcription factor domain-containing protein n=1 Tax=Melanomma pulvis-pyrius CBS 109.77 TaxID=1314802 RepID=A0A6A6X1C2_9PLEO|nr:hypothetical protein K505DRAFT_341047 [Melanomma pulvis-pyrius CBS 109.77]
MTGFLSISEAQEVYYNEAKKLYRSQRISGATVAVELLLAQTALLLSFWAPQDTEAEANSCWVDRAIYHARSVLAKSDISKGRQSGRLRVLYWSCHLRNTQLSYALRRPHRLHSMTNCLFSADDLIFDFANERRSPQFCDQQTKFVQIHLFIWSCKLSQILNNALIFRGHCTNQVLWTIKKPVVQYSTDEDERRRADALTDSRLSYFGLEKYELEILQLEATYLKILSLDISSIRIPCKWKGCSEIIIPLYNVLIMSRSSIVSLYEPFVSQTGSPHCEDIRQQTFLKLQDASSAVAIVVDKLLSLVRLDAIPVSFVAWVIFPAAVLLIAPCRHSSDEVRSPAVSERVHSSHERSPFRLIRLQMSRFKGAQAVWKTMQDVYSLTTKAASSESLNFSSVPQSSKRTKDCSSEVDLLAHILRLLDLDLSYGKL